MKSAKLKEAIPSEAALCAFFIAEFNEQPGWTCYPETGGFDVLVVHESGRQIGVEAKLQLNAKVAEQILPAHYWFSSDAPGPDHRLVIVRNITEASAGIARMLECLGIHVWSPWVGEDVRRNPETRECERVPRVQFNIQNKLWEDERCAKASEYHNGHWRPALPDWNPCERIEVPVAVPDLPAGVPAPVRMTPWKQAAVRVLARLRAQGHITTRQIAAEGCSPSIWTQKWLDRAEERGKWIESERMPKFDEHHPELFALALTALQQEPSHENQ